MAGGGADFGELSRAAGPDPDERLDVVLLDEAAWKAMLSRGAVQDAKTWAAWGMFETKHVERRAWSVERKADDGGRTERRTKNEEPGTDYRLTSDLFYSD